ncbi:MAG: hypothetical protein GY795_26900, partial [Desulfobacterales bacterium]|nr:hypothetical protein [Desulfobacterales bacterium]
GGAVLPQEVSLTLFEHYMAADFGYRRHDNAIGDFIWDDMNGDGVQDADEPGIANVTVDLIEPGPDGVFDTGDDWVLVTEATDETGHYIFTDLWPATYRVNVTDTGLVLGGYIQSGGAVLPHEVSLTLFEHYMAADFGYQLESASSVAEISDPAAGSVLSSTTETFTWNNSGASQYWLWVGTSAGSNDLDNSDRGTDTSATVSGLPTDGETLYVRLWSKVNGEWLYKTDSIYTACNNSSAIAEILSPASASTLDSTTETFTWNDTGAEQYWLWIGTTAGGNDVGNWDKGTDTSATVSGLPDNGETLYARLWSKVNGGWVFKADSIYTACNNGSSAAEIQTPASGSVLDSTTETFAWNDTGAEQYWLWIGTSAGGNDVANLDQGTDTSATVSGLPGSGETLYVRLWSKVGGEWLYKSDSICTASGP